MRESVAVIDRPAWWSRPLLEASCGVLAALAVGASNLTVLPVTLWLTWSLVTACLHAGALVAGNPRVELARVLAVTAAWSAALWYCTLAGAVQIVLAGFLFIQIVLIVSSRVRAVHAETKLAVERRTRTDTEAAFLQAVEEIRRLKVEVRTSGDVHEQLSAALQESTSELSVVRHKADALATTLQRVMPFEPESGLLNAEKFTAVLEREAARMQRQELPLTVVLARIDYFKDFETTHGRVAYEIAIRKIADALQQAGQRPGDIAARLDAGTFALLFPEAEQHFGLRLAEAVRQRVQEYGLSNRLAPPGKVTLSLGCATLIPNTEFSSAILRERAEAALYEATFQGGNRCVRFSLLQSIKIERWNSDDEGILTLERLKHKLKLRGFAGTAKRLKPGESGREKRVSLDSIEAVVEGALQIEVDGETRTLRAGDCLYLPKGVVTRVQVLGEQPVVCIEATRG